MTSFDASIVGVVAKKIVCVKIQFCFYCVCIQKCSFLIVRHIQTCIMDITVKNALTKYVN